MTHPDVLAEQIGRVYRMACEAGLHVAADWIASTWAKAVVPMDMVVDLAAVRADRLSPPQRKVLEAIVALTDELGYPPTTREIGERTGTTSTSTTHAHLVNLRRLGVISHDPTKPRTVRVLVP